MTEGLEVVIKYRGAKHNQVVAKTTSSAVLAILKKDLAHLRVHSPSQKNVHCVDGSFFLHWPLAGTSSKAADGPADSLYTRWFKLCSGDPEARKLREYLSIGVLICSTATVAPGPEQPEASQGASQTVARVERSTADSDSIESAQQQPQPQQAQTPSSPAMTATVKLPLPPTPKFPFRLTKQVPVPPRIKRRLSSQDSEESSRTTAMPTRRKLDTDGPGVNLTDADAQSTTPPWSTSINTSQPQPEQVDVPTGWHKILGSPRGSLRSQVALADEDTVPVNSGPAPMSSPASYVPLPASMHVSASTPAPMPTISQPRLGLQHEEHAILPLGSKSNPASPASDREPGEMNPHTHTPGPPNSVSGPDPGPGGLGGAPMLGRPPLDSGTGGGHGEAASRRRDRGTDVSSLMRELWDTRREITALQERERVILNDLGQLGARSPAPEKSHGSGVDIASRDELARLEAELRAEKTRRVDVERALNDVQRECRTPFIVPALFEAFMNISELSG